jgi:hypothetical protein
MKESGTRNLTMDEEYFAGEKERRRHQRLSVAGRLYVDACRKGLISDISLNGLAFHYIDRRHWQGDCGKLTIICDEREFSLSGIAYRVISDEPVKKQSDSALLVKRMGLAFERLSEEQEKKIASLLDACTSPPRKT